MSLLLMFLFYRLYIEVSLQVLIVLMHKTSKNVVFEELIFF